MRFYKIIIVLSFLAYQKGWTQSPKVTLLESGKRVSFRGLSVVNDHIFWASGSNGTVVRSLDGGKTIEWITVPGFEKRDFRDIEAIDAETAVIMGIAEPAVILKTKDGGKTWNKVFEDSTQGMFMDAMDLYIDSTLIHNTGAKGRSQQKTASHTMVVVGDPIDGKLFVAMSYDAGDSWQVMPAPKDNKDVRWGAVTEGMFASSGSNVKLTGLKNVSPILLVTGGSKARLKDLSGHRFNDSLPMMQGGTSTGANSIDFMPATQSAVIVGGDFAKDSIATDNCVLVSFRNGQPYYSKPVTPPYGYRSSVIFLNEKELITCGTSGIDISKDGGVHWQPVAKDSYHVVQKARNGKAVYLAGGSGKIARLEW